MSIVAGGLGRGSRGTVVADGLGLRIVAVLQRYGGGSSVGQYDVLEPRRKHDDELLVIITGFLTTIGK